MVLLEGLLRLCGRFGTLASQLLLSSHLGGASGERLRLRCLCTRAAAKEAAAKAAAVQEAVAKAAAAQEAAAQEAAAQEAAAQAAAAQETAAVRAARQVAWVAKATPQDLHDLAQKTLLTLAQREANAAGGGDLVLVARRSERAGPDPWRFETPRAARSSGHLPARPPTLSRRS